MHGKLLNFFSFIALSLISGGAVAEVVIHIPNPPTPIKLSAREFTFLENRVCHANYSVAAATIQAFKFDTRVATDTKIALPARTSAYVECQPHGQFNNKPMRYVDECDLVGSEWDCSPPQLEILVPINGRDVKMRPWGLTPEKAHDLLKHLGTLQIFQGESIDKAIGNSCDVSKTKDPEEIEFSCDTATMALSFRCPLAEQTGCPRLLYLTFDKPAYLRRRHL